MSAMSPKPKPGAYKHPAGQSGNPRIVNDVVGPTNTTNFPNVGMTLSSYQSTGSRPSTAKGRPFSQPVNQSRWQRIRQRVTLKRVVLSVLLVLVLIGGWLGWKFIYNAHKVFGGNILGILHTTKLKGEDSGRVNILLAGNSADDPGHQGAYLTDSIMIISIDTKNNTAFMLSVPRDLYVSIPGYGHQKINAANVDGEAEDFSASGYPDGGMGLLEQLVSKDFGIQIDYYALVNYTAFRDTVNAVGGIDVTIQSTDKRGLYDPSIDYTTHGPLVKLTNGVHHLDGQQALDLARARGDAYGSYGFPQSDFDRTTHQRQMLVALKAKATTAGVLANPVKLSSLFDAIGSNVKTDFNLSEVRRLFDLTKNISSNNIQSIGLTNVNGQDLLANYQTSEGQSALVPAAGIDDYSDIQAFIRRLTSNNPVVKENASVVVLNGTNSFGVAKLQASRLEDKYVNVSAMADALNSDQTVTQIIDASGGTKPTTKQLLTSLYGSNVTTTNPYASKYPQASFIIVVGTDQVTASQ